MTNWARIHVERVSINNSARNHFILLGGTSPTRLAIFHYSVNGTVVRGDLTPLLNDEVNTTTIEDQVVEYIVDDQVVTTSLISIDSTTPDSSEVFCNAGKCSEFKIYRSKSE